MRKKNLILAFFILLTFLIKGQDTIIKADRSNFILCKVTRVTPMTVFYTENKIGKSIPKNEISYYSTHEIQSLKEKEAQVKKLTDYKFYFKEDVLKNSKYKFSISEVVDARLNKKKPIGSVLFGMAIHKKTVGNDSIAEEMESGFDKIRQCFDSSNPIILVINQINIRFVYSYGKTKTKGAKEDLEMNVSLEYYKINGNTYDLIYQQYYSHKHNASWEFSATNGVSMAFSEAIKLGFEDFDKELSFNRPLNNLKLSYNDFNKLYKLKPSQEVNKKNIKDGIYFSCRDIYLNRPAIIQDFDLKDSLDNGRCLFIFKTNSTVFHKSYAIIRAGKIFIHFEDYWYKKVLFADDGKLYYASKKDTSIATKNSIDFETGN
jgi:hypothetical protein